MTNGLSGLIIEKLDFLYLGVYSFSVVVVIGLHMLFDLVIPSNSQTFYLTKDFASIFFLFFAIPLSTIFQNSSMKSYIRLHFFQESETLEKVSEFMKEIKRKSNSVSDVKCVSDASC